MVIFGRSRFIADKTAAITELNWVNIKISIVDSIRSIDSSHTVLWCRCIQDIISVQSVLCLGVTGMVDIGTTTVTVPSYRWRATGYCSICCTLECHIGTFQQHSIWWCCEIYRIWITQTFWSTIILKTILFFNIVKKFALGRSNTQRSHDLLLICSAVGVKVFHGVSGHLQVLLVEVLTVHKKSSQIISPAWPF